MVGQDNCKYKPPAINLTYFKSSSTPLTRKEMLGHPVKVNVLGVLRNVKLVI